MYPTSACLLRFVLRDYYCVQYTFWIISKTIAACAFGFFLIIFFNQVLNYDLEFENFTSFRSVKWNSSYTSFVKKSNLRGR